MAPNIVKIGNRLIDLDEEEIELSDLEDGQRFFVDKYNFTVIQLKELNNMLAILQRAKNSYINEIEKEMISKKAGFIFEDWCLGVD